MKKVLFIFMCLPIFLSAQFENRTHVLAGGNLKLTDQSYELYDSYVVGAESIFGFRIGKIFLGAGTGIEYTGSNRFNIIDSLLQIPEEKNFSNFDLPIFLDFTYGKRLYLEVKLGYSIKLNSLDKYFEINTNTLFHTLGLGYSIPLGNAYVDLSAEGRFNYLFTNTVSVSQNGFQAYFSPVLRAGFRFTKRI